MYFNVLFPREAPDKQDHDYVDFVVYLPRRHTLTNRSTSNHGTSNGGYEDSTGNTIQLINVPHNVVTAAIGAQYVNPMNGNRTSNFAIPVGEGEWSQYGLKPEENRAREEARNGEIFYQVSHLVLKEFLAY